MVLVDGAPSTMTYLPTKFTIVLGRDDDVRHAGLWYMHLVRFGHGKFLIVSAADLQKHDRDTHAAVYISQTSHHAHAERLLFDTGNKFGHVWADMGDVNGFSPNTGDVLASQRRFTLANGDAGGASCQFESILYAEPSIPLHTVTNYGIAMAPRTLVCALQPGATAPFTSENLAPPAKTDTDVIAACFADTVIGSGVPNITNAGREPFVIGIDSAPGYDSPAVNALVDWQLTPELCSAIRATYRGGRFRSNRELRDAYGHLGKRHMKWLDEGDLGDDDIAAVSNVQPHGLHTTALHISGGNPGSSEYFLQSRPEFSGGPKRGAARTRYDGYKSATTIDEFLRYGGTYADLANDTDKRRKFVVFVDQPAADLKALLSLEQDVQRLMGDDLDDDDPAPPRLAAVAESHNVDWYGDPAVCTCAGGCDWCDYYDCIDEFHDCVQDEVGEPADADAVRFDDDVYFLCAGGVHDGDDLGATEETEAHDAQVN